MEPALGVLGVSGEAGRYEGECETNEVIRAWGGLGEDEEDDDDEYSVEYAEEDGAEESAGAWDALDRRWARGSRGASAPGDELDCARGRAGTRAGERHEHEHEHHDFTLRLVERRIS
jgi:hypothetical protein